MQNPARFAGTGNTPRNQEETDMKKLAITAALLAAMGAAQATTYTVTTTWRESMASVNAIFQGSFDYDALTHTVSGLQGQLSEVMTGKNPAGVVWLDLSYQL